MSGRKYRPDVGQWMSDKAYKRYKTVEFKANHHGTDRAEAKKCREQLSTIVERDNIPIEEKTYRRKGEGDEAFRQRVKQAHQEEFQPNRKKSSGNGGYNSSFWGFSRSYQESEAKWERQRERDKERIKREQEAWAQFQDEQRKAEQYRQQANAQSRQQVRSQWQESSDALHAQRQRGWPTGPKQTTNTKQPAQQAVEINPFVLFVVLFILYLMFF